MHIASRALHLDCVQCMHRPSRRRSVLPVPLAAARRLALPPGCDSRASPGRHSLRHWAPGLPRTGSHLHWRAHPRPANQPLGKQRMCVGNTLWRIISLLCSISRCIAGCMAWCVAGSRCDSAAALWNSSGGACFARIPSKLCC